MAENEVWCMNMGGWAGYEEEVAQTLRARDYKDPSILFIPCESYAMTTEMTPKIGKEVAPTLNEGGGEETWSMTVGSWMTAEKDLANTVMARDYKDPPIVFVPRA